MTIHLKIKYILILLIQYSTLCSGCPDGMKLFLDDEGLPECFSCRDCPRGATKVANCTYKHDTICDVCTYNEYYDDRSLHCKTCTVCSAGNYVKKNCGTFKNTQCDVCPRGTFSSYPDSSSCTNCTDCRGAITIQTCNRTADTVCEQSDEEEEEGSFAYMYLIAVPIAIIIVIALLLALYYIRNRWTIEKRKEKRRKSDSIRDYQPLLDLPYDQETHFNADSSLQALIDVHGITESTGNCFQGFKIFLKDMYRKMISCYADAIYGEPFAEFYMTSKTPRRPHPRKVKHIFNENKQVFKRIFVIGNASIGKTTLCRSLVRDFCRNDAHQEYLLGYGQDFDWLFYISLRRFRKWSNVYDMIAYLYFQNQEHSLLQILEAGEKILLVLDGFDEWQIPHAKNEENNVSLDFSSFDDLQNCTLLITTRPVACINLRYLETSLTCDREITIRTITKTSENRLKNAVVDKCRMGGTEITDEPYIDDDRLATQPLLLKQLVRLYCHNKIPKQPDEPLCNTFAKIILNWLKEVEFIDEIDNQCEQELPDCLTTENQNHKLILCLLGEISFDILNESDSVNSNLGALRELGFSESMINACLNTGLLTLGLDSCFEHDDLTLVSFPHILYMEYFAAVYIYMKPGSIKKILEKCTSADKIMSFRFLFIFLSGMKSCAMKTVFEMIKGILDNGKTDDENLKLSHKSLLKLQSVALDCVGEQEPSIVDLSLQNVHICLDAFNENGKVTAKTFIKSFQKCNTVHSTILELHKRLDVDMEDMLLETIKMKTDTLTTLDLRGVGCTPYFEYLYCGKLSKLIHLEISDFELPHTGKQFLMTGLAKAVAVQELVLVNISCKDHEQCPCPLDLLDCSKLKRLTLKQIQLGWVRVNTTSLTDCIETNTAVFYSPSNKKFMSSTQLKLKNIENPSDVDAFSQLLSSLSRLSYLEVSLSNFGNKDLHLPKTAVRLRKISMVRVNMTKPNLIRFIKSIPRGEHDINCEFDEITVISFSERDINKIVKLKSYEVCVPYGINFRFEIKHKWLLKTLNE